MIRLCSCLFLCAIPSTLPSGEAKQTPVKIDNLQALAPADWKSEKPANRLRSYQFRLPRAKDDKDDAELVILPNLSGTNESNIARWKEMFLPPDGKTIEEVSKVTSSKAGAVKLTTLEVTGTYLYKDRPLSAKTPVPKANYRMFSVIFETDEGPSLIRLVGPAATVEHHRARFEAFLKSFK